MKSPVRPGGILITPTRSWVLCLLIVLPLLGGCDGCRKDPATDEPETPVPVNEFTTGTPLPFPADGTITNGAIKPGHWFTASQSIKANVGDRRGRLRSSINQPVLDNEGLVTGQSVTSPMESSRPVVLPKSQKRQFEFRLLAPMTNGLSESRFTLQSRLEIAGQAGSLAGNSQPYNVMAPHEYFFVVLTDRPDRFARLKVADWVRPLSSPARFKEPVSNYRIVIPPVDGILSLPETMLDWTSVAVVLWDNLPADRLTPGQLQAMTDWVNFGGRLIVNGSSASESLHRSAFGPSLPFRPTGNLELPQASASEFLRGWSVPTDTTIEKQIALVGDGTARIMVDGGVTDGANELTNSGGLIVRRELGRGKVTQSRFDLTSDWVTSWSSYDSFWNNALLGRPQRQLVRQKSRLSEDDFVHEFVATGSGRGLATLNTSFRLLTRDAALKRDTSSKVVDQTPATLMLKRRAFRPHGAGDIGGWSEDSEIVRDGVERLRANAGIEIPSRSLVVKSLAAYLFLLVPLNFLIFRLIGRVEWAWFVIPVLAVIGAVAVARIAQLDIGFARSQTELCVLEIQSNHDRGHLSRLVAVYNSLTTTYDVAFDSPDGVAAPIGLMNQNSESATADFQSAASAGPALSGFSVDSNRIGMLRCEQLVDLGGAVTLVSKDGSRVLRNGTSQSFSRGYVLHRTDDEVLRIALLSELQAGRSVRVEFERSLGPKESVDAAVPKGDGSLDMFGLKRLLLTDWYVRPGETRLIATLDEPMEGFSVSPPAGQTTTQTVVVVNLESPTIVEPVPDVNLLTDFRRAQTDVSVDTDVLSPTADDIQEPQE